MQKIEISHRTIVFTILFLGLIWLVIQILPIITGLFIAILLMTALNPVVNTLVRFRIPRLAAILFVYLVFVGLLVGGLTSIVPPLVEQTGKLAERLPVVFDDAGAWLEGVGIKGVNGELVANQLAQVGSLPANIVRFALSLFSNMIAVFSVLVITFYLLFERRNLDKYLGLLFGQNKIHEAKRFVLRIESTLGGWVRGELTLMFIIGLMDYIGLLLLGIPYALPLAILAGLLEIVPVIGPVVSAVPAVLLALTMSPFMALATVALYFLVQQLENNLVVPKVMEKATGVNPLITILVIAIGARLAGVAGALLAVPVFLVLQVVAIEIFALKALQKL